MKTSITNKVKVSVETFYKPQASNPDANHFVFTYKVTIENFGENTIKLLRRHWHIIDSLNEKQEVEGDGIIGQQPVLEPGQVHEYVSGCHLRSELGKMHGSYLMQKQLDGTTFEVKIPEFFLIAPYRLN